MGADGYHEAPSSANRPKIQGDWTGEPARLTSGPPSSMRLPLPWFALACLALLGCSSDESVVCERLDECKELPEGLTVSDCEDQAVRQVPEDRLSKCAECVEDHGCDEVVTACRDLCEPGD